MKDETYTFRISGEEKSRFEAAAMSKGLTLADWIRHECTKEANKVEDNVLTERRVFSKGGLPRKADDSFGGIDIVGVSPPFEGASLNLKLDYENALKLIHALQLAANDLARFKRSDSEVKKLHVWLSYKAQQARLNVLVVDRPLKGNEEP